MTKQQKPRLLAIANFSADNGTERMISSVLQGLSFTWDVLLLSAQRRGGFYKSLMSYISVSGRLRQHRKRGAFWLNMILIFMRILIHRPAILMVFNYQMGLSTGAALHWMPKKLRPKKAILVHHISVAAVTSATELKRMRCYFPCFTKHVVPSHALCAELITTVPTLQENALQAIHNGLDLKAILKLSKVPVEPFYDGSVQWHCIYVGGLRDDKRVDRLLRCFSCLPEKKQTLLTLVGDGLERDALEQLAESLGVRERCVFLGHQENPYPYIVMADLLVQTSDWETFGLSLLEGMLLKTTVLAMKGYSLGLLDVVQDQINGRLVENADEEAFVAAWSELLQKGCMRESLASQAYTFAAEFTVENMVESYRSLLEAE